MAADRGVAGVIDRPGLEQRLGAAEQLLHLEKVTVAQHGLKGRDLGLLRQAQDEDTIKALNALSRFSIGKLAGIDLKGGFDPRGLLVCARGSSQITPVG